MYQHHEPVSQFMRLIKMELEHIWWDPKDGELLVHKIKPEETLVEVCNDADVQNARLMGVEGRKTNRTI